MRPPVLVPAAVATALLVALACAATVVASHPPGAGGLLRAPAPAPAPAPVPAGERSDPVTPAPVGPGEGPRSAGEPAPRPAPPRAVAVLRDWDARRGAAWAQGDAAALRDLYVPGSGAGAADVAMLRAWRARGLRVTGLRPQLLAVRAVARGPGHLVVRVTERLGGTVAVGAGVRRVLPASAVATRRVELRRSGGAWRVVEVVTGAARVAQARPAASTSRTSRSQKA